MKAKVYVTLKPSVLDPQGKAIKHSIELLGYNGISDIRQGKYFEIAIEGQQTAEQARTETMRMAHDVLSNPIIEPFRLSLEHEVSTTRVSGWGRHSISGLDVRPTRSRRWY